MVYANEEQVCFNVEVRVPFALAEAFAAAMTGDDEDVILAAETAMRERIDALGARESIELHPDDSVPVGSAISTVKRELLEAAATDDWSRT